MTNLKTGENNLHPVSSSTGEPENNRIILGGRIRESREAVGIARNEAATAVGVSVSTFQAWEAGEREPDATKLSIFAKRYRISVEWLLFGEGAMQKGGVGQDAAPVQPGTVACSCQDTLGNPVDLAEFVFIPRYNLKASAGNGAAVAGEKPMFSMSFRKYWIDNFLRIDPKNLSVISVKGDSMEGVLNDRDVILVNHADNQPGSGLYVLRVDGDLIVKRVQRLPGGKLEVSSSNSAYKPFEVDLNKANEGFSVIGRVVWFGRQI